MAYYTFVVRGTVALVLGIALLFAGSDLRRLAMFVAFYWIAAALLTLRWVRANRVARGRRLASIAGTTGLAAGIAVVLRPLLDALVSEGVLLDLLGVSALATGLLRLLGLFRDDQFADERPRRRYRFVLGPLEVLLGIALLFAEDSTAGNIRLALAVWGLSTGTFLLLDGLMLRRLARPQSGSPAAGDVSARRRGHDRGEAEHRR